MPIEILHRFGQLLYDLRSMHILTLLLNLHLTGCWLEKYRNFQNICETQFSFSFPNFSTFIDTYFSLKTSVFSPLLTFPFGYALESGFVLEILENCFSHFKTISVSSLWNTWRIFLDMLYVDCRTVLYIFFPYTQQPSPKPWSYCNSNLFITAHAPWYSNASHRVV